MREYWHESQAEHLKTFNLGVDQAVNALKRYHYKTDRRIRAILNLMTVKSCQQMLSSINRFKIHCHKSLVLYLSKKQSRL